MIYAMAWNRRLDSWSKLEWYDRWWSPWITWRFEIAAARDSTWKRRRRSLLRVTSISDGASSLATNASQDPYNTGLLMLQIFKASKRDYPRSSKMALDVFIAPAISGEPERGLSAVPG